MTIQELMDTQQPVVRTMVMHPVLSELIRQAYPPDPNIRPLFQVALKESLYMDHSSIACFDAQGNLVKVIVIE